jgi:hypothetical protein
MEWDNNQQVVPVQIVRLLFDQMKEAYDRNTQSIQTLTTVVNDLMKHMTDRDITTELNTLLERIKEHESCCYERQKDIVRGIVDIIDKNSLNTKDISNMLKEQSDNLLNNFSSVKDMHTEMAHNIDNISNTVIKSKGLLSGIKNKIIIILTVISIVVTIAGYMNFHYNRVSNAEKTSQTKVK